MDLDLVQRKLRRFARVDAVEVSPLYAHLSGHAAEDPSVAGLLLAAKPEFADPTLLFAAIHRALQAVPYHALSSYYPSLGGSYGPDDELWPLFRTFVLERAEAIRELIATRTTQTNEVRRAAVLFPALGVVAKEVRGPIGLLEVGCSAGLLLGLDRYGYHYQTEEAGQVAGGPAKAMVGLHCALELEPGAVLPVIPKKLAVGARIGLDRAPVDLTDEEQYAWLEACIWPDQPERLRLFGAAAVAQRAQPPDLVAGDAVDDLPAAAAHVPVELPLVVLTSVALMYFPDERRAAFLSALGDLAEDRKVYWVSLEGYQVGLEAVLPGRADLLRPSGEPSFGLVGVVRWDGGRPVARALAKASWHGQRMRWLPQP